MERISEDSEMNFWNLSRCFSRRASITSSEGQVEKEGSGCSSLDDIGAELADWEEVEGKEGLEEVKVIAEEAGSEELAVMELKETVEVVTAIHNLFNIIKSNKRR